jgi:hypothetical protein
LHNNLNPKQILQDGAGRIRKLLETGTGTSPIVLETAGIHDDLLDQMLAEHSQLHPPMEPNGSGIGPTVGSYGQSQQGQYHHDGVYAQQQPQYPYNSIAYHGNSWVMGLCANFHRKLENKNLKLFLFIVFVVNC